MDGNDTAIELLKRAIDQLDKDHKWQVSEAQQCEARAAEHDAKARAIVSQIAEYARALRLLTNNRSIADLIASAIRA